jgi:hypothetical protein
MGSYKMHLIALEVELNRAMQIVADLKGSQAAANTKWLDGMLKYWNNEIANLETRIAGMKALIKEKEIKDNEAR